MFAAIEMRSELDAVLIYLAALREAKDLVAATVGEDRLIPADELVETTPPRDQFVAGPEHQVVGIAEDYARPEFIQMLGGQCFNGALGADWHERRSLDRAVGRLKDSPPGCAISMGESKQMVPTPYYR